MIKPTGIYESARHRGLKRLVEVDNGRQIRRDLLDRIRKILAALIAAPAPLERGGLVRPRQAEDMLGQIGEDQVGGDRRHLIEPGLAKLPLDIVFLGKTKAAVGL